MNITNNKFKQIIKEEIDRAFPNGKVSLDPDENDRLELSQTLGKIESLAELASDPEEVKWHVSNIKELFGVDI